MYDTRAVIFDDLKTRVRRETEILEISRRVMSNTATRLQQCMQFDGDLADAAFKEWEY
jgi:hypothetical protein